MRRFRDIPIRRKQMLIILLTCGVALLLACAAFVAYDLVIFRRGLVENVSSLAEVVGNNSTGALDFNDPKSAQESLGALRGEPSVAFACIYDREGRPFATYVRKNSPALTAPPIQATSHEFTGKHLRLFRTIKQGNETIGAIYIASSLEEFTERITGYAGIVAVVLTGSLLVALILSSRLQRVISGPVLHLAEMARSVAQEKNYSLRARKHSEDELGQLVDGFNEMLAEIQERDFALQAARDTLEYSVKERTQELASSVSLLNAALEASVDGILAMDLEGRITSYNGKFVELWGYSSEVIERRDSDELLALALTQVRNAGAFQARISETRESPETQTLEVLEFHDGRIVQRMTRPQYIGDTCVGTVITYRDVTEHRRSEAAVRESQALYHSLVEQLPTGVFRKDAKGRYVFVNSWFYRLKGMTAEQILGKTPQEMVSDPRRVPGAVQPGEWEARLAHQGAEHHELIMRTGTHVEVEEAYPAADGKVRHLQVVKTPVFGVGGKIVGTQGIMFDVSERKRAAEILRRTEELYRSAITGAGAVPYSYDFRSKTYVFMGEGIQQLIGYAPHEVNGQLWKGIIHKSIMLGEAAGVDKDEAARRVKAGDLRHWRCDMLVTTADGKSRWILDASVQNLDESGRVTGSVGILQDITERKEAEAELERTHRQLLDISRAAGMAEVATSVLHNVGNVLNSVNTSASLVADCLRTSREDGVSRAAELLEQNRGNLAEFLSTGRADQFINYLRSLALNLAAERKAALIEMQELNKNIEHIKEIVVMQQGYAKVSGVTEKVKPVDLLEDALRMNEGALDRHGVELVREYAPGLPEIIVEKHKVLQILVNLIRNAKYACDDSGSTNKQLTLRVTNGDDRIRIAIVDNGVGIPPENLTRIFSHGFTTRKHGHGFGLHSGALAAREMGGSLSAHSEGVGQGATFTLELPSTHHVNDKPASPPPAQSLSVAV